jgi:medium-chain acyl-[acyl-carrier-protein] hydrolase
MNNPDILELEYEVRGFDCGYGGSFKALSLANFFQEAACLDAVRRGFGMGKLASAGHTWMLSRIDFRIDRLPDEGERVKIRTWPSGCQRLFALRDIVLEDSSGGSLVKAVYAYIIVDVTARKPLRPEHALSPELLGAQGAHSIPDFRLGTSPIAEPESVYELTARPRHIDENGHVNNGHIMDWLVDAASERLERFPSELKIDFIQEVLEGDRLEAVVGTPSKGDAPAPSEHALATELRRDGVAVARAEFLF